MENGVRGIVHDRPEVHGVAPLLGGHVYLGDVRIARIRGPKQGHVQLAFPLSVKLTETKEK